MIHPLFRLCILGTFLLSSYACLENSMQKSIEVVTLSHSGTRINSTLAKSALFGRSDALSMNYSTENMLNNNACDCKKNFSYPDVITNVTEAFNYTLENLVNLQANKNLYHNMGGH